MKTIQNNYLRHPGICRISVVGVKLSPKANQFAQMENRPVLNEVMFRKRRLFIRRSKRQAATGRVQGTFSTGSLLK